MWPLRDTGMTAGGTGIAIGATGIVIATGIMIATGITTATRDADMVMGTGGKGVKDIGARPGTRSGLAAAQEVGHECER